MAIRILTGILMTRKPEGRATVSFRPHAVSGDADGVGLSETGPAGEYLEVPGTTVGLREVTVTEKGQAKIDHHAHTTSLLEIGWTGVNEITYLIVGEVGDA